MYQADETEATSPPPPKDRAEAARVAVAVMARAADVKVNTDSANDTNHPGKSGRPMRNFGDHL